VKAIFWISMVLIVLGLLGTIFNLMVQLTITMIILGVVMLLCYVVCLSSTDTDGM
jgi:hypothetical protein